MIVAWGEPNLYRLAGDEHLWGREFEILTGNSMMPPRNLLHGLIGVDAVPLEGGMECQIKQGSPLVIYGMGDTTTDELMPYQDLLVEGFNQRIEQRA